MKHLSIESPLNTVEASGKFFEIIAGVSEISTPV